MSEKYSLQWVLDQFDANPEVQFIQFWCEGLPDPRAYFNQWHPAKFVYKGFEFHNAEQAMMAEKAMIFDDIGTLNKILQCHSPRAVKALGREVKGYDDPVWAAHRQELVTDISVAKFSQNADMLAALIATDNAILVEASPEDKLWGTGLTQSDPDSKNPHTWKGLNMLGQSLMEARYILSPF